MDELRRSGVVRGCLLVLLAVVSYAPAYEAGFVFDDEIYVTGDERLETAGGLWRIWTEVSGGSEGYKHQWYPMTGTVLWVEHALWGLEPFGYHFVNVLLHALNAVLLWRLLARLGLGAGAAWVTGAVFALHPVHVPSVAWVSELKNVLSTALFLGAAWCMTRWWQAPGEKKSPGDFFAAKKSPGDFFYAAGVLLFVAALLSKTATCLLPVALLIAWWWKQGQIGRRELLGVAPLAVVGAVLVGVTIALETSYGTGGEEYGTTAWDRWLVAGRSTWFYAAKLVYPANLMMMYPRWAIDAAIWWQHLYPVAALGVLAALWFWRTRIGRGPLAAAAYFVVAVMPVSLVTVAFTRFSWVADHWAYWGSMGLIAMAVGAAAWCLKRVPRGREAGLALACLVLGTLGVLTWQRAQLFESSETLWADTVERNPMAFAAHNNLGHALSESGRYDEAIVHYQAALAIRPGDPGPHHNLGLAFGFKGDQDRAIAEFRRALALAPSYPEAHVKLADVLRGRGEFDEARAHYQRALRASPRYAAAHYGMALVLIHDGLGAEARVEFERAIELDPGFADAHYELAGLLRQSGGVELALLHYAEAVRLLPGFVEARNDLGSALLACGRVQEAIEQYQAALELEPRYGPAQRNLELARSRSEAR